MKTWLKMIFCKHRSLRFVRNIYGDEIIFRCAGRYRSVWVCNRCGSFRDKPELVGQP